MSVEDRRSRVRWWAAMAALVSLGLALSFVRWSAPSDVLDNVQLLTASYTADIYANGEWIVQRDPTGRPATKPPLQPWLAAIASYPFGRVTWLSVGIPVALSTIATALLAAFVARRWFGDVAGVLAGGATLFNPVIVKHIWLIRPDAVYMLAVFAGTLLVWRAWDRGRGWHWAWLAAAVVCLAKTPFGVLAMFCGLLGGLTMRDELAARRVRGARLWIENIAGALLCAAIVGGWFLAARARLGEAFTATTLHDEMVGHALGMSDDQFFGKGFLRAPLYVLVRLAPWSVVAIIALVRLLREPAEEPRQRRLERFLYFAFVGGLVVAGFAAKPRAEHIIPLCPLVAVLAGRELAGWSVMGRRRAMATVCIAGFASAGAAYFQYHVARPALPKVVLGAGMEELASDVRPLLDEGASFEDVDAPYALQFALGTMRVQVSPEEAARRLESDGAVLVFVTRAGEESVRSLAQTPVEVVARWPLNGEPEVVALGNAGAGALRVERRR